MKKFTLILLSVLVALILIPNATLAVANELITNGDFAKKSSLDLPVGWSFDAWDTSVDSQAQMDTDDLDEHGSVAYIKSSALNDTKLYQSIKVEPNSYYLIQCDIRTNDVAAGAGANISVLNCIAATQGIMGDSGWTRVSFYGVTDASQTEVDVAIRLGGYGALSKGEAWFDNISATKLSEQPMGTMLNMFSTENTNSDASEPTKNTPYVGIAILVFLLGAIACVCVYVRKSTPKNISNTKILPGMTDTKLHFARKDYIFLIALIVVYSVIALTNLGTTQAPENSWVARFSDDEAVIQFDSTVEVSSIYVFGGIAENGAIAILDAKGDVVGTYSQEYGHMFRWQSITQDAFETDTITVRVENGTVDFKELAFLDANGNKIVGTATGAAAALVDEPEEIPDTFSYLNGMYFDELYHGRTGYEHLHNLTSYENSHPPLGKIFISIGIALFGMNAFGWRVIGVLFGIGMIPIIYCLGKRLFKRSEYALLTAVLFAFDFMHFVQTRIATIDVYGVFFILLMFYFMYKYFTMNFFVDGLVKTLLPLGLAGIFFGLGAASKWICFYAGGGLAILLVISIVQRIIEYRKVMQYGTADEKAKVSFLARNIVITLVFCCVFFLLIPGAIYLFSYLRYPDVTEAFKTNGIKGYIGQVWHYQEFMFKYHSQLDATHPFQSTWYEWVLNLRPIWYYKGDTSIGYVSTISAFGNPAVWVVSLLGTLGMIVQLIRKKIKLNAGTILVLIGIVANLGPWMLVTRCTFIYHYFATVPFIIIGAVMLLKSLEDEFKWLRYVKWGWMLTCLGLFAMFYPFLTGTVTTQAYMNLMQWLPRWTFIGVAGTDNGRVFGVFICIAVIIAFIIAGIFSKNHYDKKMTMSGDKNE